MSVPPARNWHPKLREAQFGEAVVRQQLFNVRDTIIFTKEEWEERWKYIDNVYSFKYKGAITAKDTQLFHYHCRFCRKTWEPKNRSSIRKRNKGTHEGNTC